jgi:hypothetical protein
MSGTDAHTTLIATRCYRGRFGIGIGALLDPSLGDFALYSLLGALEARAQKDSAIGDLSQTVADRPETMTVRGGGVPRGWRSRIEGSV